MQCWQALRVVFVKDWIDYPFGLINFWAPPCRSMAARLARLVNIVIHSFAHRKQGQVCAIGSQVFVAVA